MVIASAERDAQCIWRRCVCECAIFHLDGNAAATDNTLTPHDLLIFVLTCELLVRLGGVGSNDYNNDVLWLVANRRAIEKSTLNLRTAYAMRVWWICTPTTIHRSWAKIVANGLTEAVIFQSQGYHAMLILNLYKIYFQRVTACVFILFLFFFHMNMSHMFPSGKRKASLADTIYSKRLMWVISHISPTQLKVTTLGRISVHFKYPWRRWISINHGKLHLKTILHKLFWLSGAHCQCQCHRKEA